MHRLSAVITQLLEVFTTMKFVHGKLLNGDYAGFNVRVENDSEKSGGFYFIIESPTDPQQGGDYWVETFEDVERGLIQKDWTVQWDQPLADLLNRDTD